MDKRFRLFLILSLFLHTLAFYLFYEKFLTKRITFKKEETKIINIKLTKQVPQELISSNENNASALASTGIVNRIRNQISIELKEGIAVSVNESMYNYNNYTHKSVSSFRRNTNILNRDNIKDPKWNIEEINEGISLTDGNFRKLIYYDKSELESFKILSNNEISLLITINRDGFIENAVIERSSGDADKDRQIIRIVSAWKFEEGETSDRGVLRLKYFLM